jgi:hypothetical protein
MPVPRFLFRELANSQREGLAREVGFDIDRQHALARASEDGMKFVLLILSVYLGACSYALAQSSGGSSAGSSAGAGGTAAGPSLSNGSTINGKEDHRVPILQMLSITARQEII